MNAKRLAYFEQLLVTERARITDALERIAATAPLVMAPDDAMPGEEGEAGAAGVAPEDDDAIVARETAALREVDDALRLIRESPQQYGTCADCGRPIADARLEMLPATRLCGRAV